MRKFAWIAILLLASVLSASAQTVAEREAALRAAAPYAQMVRAVPGLTLQEYNNAIRDMAMQAPRTRAALPTLPSVSSPPSLVGEDGTYLGTLSSNKYDPNSVSNPYGQYGSRYSPTSINNPYSVYGSPYSAYSATNPYATQAPKIVDPYAGRLSANPYAPDSTSNKYGPYGSPYSPTSINNPYSAIGSPYSPSGVTNPYAVKPLAPLPTLPTLPTLKPIGSR